MSTSPDSTEMSQSPNTSSLSPSPRSGGDGRQLPSTPTVTPMSVNQNAIQKGQQVPNNRGSNGYGPFFQEYSLMAEYDQLHQQKIPGVYTMPCSKSPLIWSGLIFVRQGLYQGAALRFTLTIPDNYPDGDCPKFAFEYPVFHPLVHPDTGSLDVKRAFPRWRRNVNHLWQVLLYAKKIFYKVDTKSPLNSEAAVLYDQEPDLYKVKVAESLKLSKERLYQSPDLDDPFALRFGPWNEAVHPETKRQMIQTTKRHGTDDSSANPSDLGLTWIDPDRTQIFSREDSGEM